MKVISLGMGVQSTAMYMMSSKNIIERADQQELFMCEEGFCGL
jgi:hypothetical protein